MLSPQEDSDLDSIQRCPHDAENPYAQILNEILRHQTLSIDAIWLLSYLLSNDRKWKIIIPQIVKHVKGRMGKNKVYDVVNELIEFGYMQRVELKRGNLKSGYKYFISEKPKFKKCFRHPENRDTEDRDPENSDNKNTKDKEYQEKEDNISLFSSSEEDQLLLLNSRVEEETPTAVVVDFFDDLKISEKLKNKILREYNTEEIKVAVRRCKDWVGRSNDEAAILTALRYSNNWNDVQKTNDAEKNREKAIEVLKKYGVSKRLTINILNGIIEFIEGSMRPICIWLADYGFMDQLENAISKMVGKNLMKKC